MELLELLPGQAGSIVEIIGTMFLDDSTNGKGQGAGSGVFFWTGVSRIGLFAPACWLNKGVEHR
jgi:hypothetical protein